MWNSGIIAKALLNWLNASFFTICFIWTASIWDSVTRSSLSPRLCSSNKSSVDLSVRLVVPAPPARWRRRRTAVVPRDYPPVQSERGCNCNEVANDTGGRVCPHGSHLQRQPAARMRTTWPGEYGSVMAKAVLCVLCSLMAAITLDLVTLCVRQCNISLKVAYNHSID